VAALLQAIPVLGVPDDRAILYGQVVAVPEIEAVAYGLDVDVSDGDAGVWRCRRRRQDRVPAVANPDALDGPVAGRGLDVDDRPRARVGIGAAPTATVEQGQAAALVMTDDALGAAGRAAGGEGNRGVVGSRSQVQGVARGHDGV